MQGNTGPALHVYKVCSKLQPLSIVLICVLVLTGYIQNDGTEPTIKECSEDDDIATPEPIFATYDLAFEPSAAH